MGRSTKYPIWVDVQACIYKSSKSYGAINQNAQTIKVGDGNKNSHVIANICTKKKVLNGITRFEFSVDGNILKTIDFDSETFKRL